MPIDARIPLGVQQFNLADILKNVEAIKGARQDREYRAHAMKREDSQDARDDAFRQAMGDYILSRGAGTPPIHGEPIVTPGDEPGAAPPPMPAGADMSQATPAPYYGGADPLAPLPGPPQGPQNGSLVASLAQAGAPGQPSSRDEAFRQMVLANPKEALAARKEQFAHLEDQMSMVARLAGSAYDQPSYERALQRASDLGLEVDHLPREFNQQMVSQVMNEALDAKDRLAAMRLDRKFEWDQADDMLDNDRADENLESLEGYRSGQLGNTRRGQDMTDRRGRRGQDMTDHRVREGKGPGGGPKTEGAVYADIMSRWTKGATPNAREREFVRAYEQRHAPRGRGRGRGRGGGGGSSGAASPPAQSGPVRVNTVAEARGLAPGTLFIAPDGKVRRR